MLALARRIIKCIFHFGDLEDESRPAPMQHSIEISLILITMVVAIVGTLSDFKGKDRAKAGLIILAVLASAGAIVKSFLDEREKELMKTALISTLNPAPPIYDKFGKEIEREIKRMGYDEFDYRHFSDGLTYSLNDSKTGRRGYLVFDRLDIGMMYSNQLAGKSNSEIILRQFDQTYKPTLAQSEDFQNRVAILGHCMFNWKYKHEPRDYHYDDDKVSFSVDVNNQIKEFQITAQEIASLKEKKAVELFVDLVDIFQKKIDDVVKD